MTFKVYPNGGIIFACNILVEQLIKLGHDAVIVRTIEPADETIHIIYCAMNCRVLPTNYIVYQTEYHKSPWFTAKYLNIIQGAICVWEHSENNIKAYRHLNNKISIVTPGVAPQLVSEKDIDFLFYGYIKGSQRRNLILQKLQKQIPLRIETNLFGENMADVLRRTKVVINIHYYENNAIEMFRINEALSYGCHVVSEKSVFGDEKYSGIVYFGEIASLANDIINKPLLLPDISSLDNLKEINDAMEYVYQIER